MRLPLIVLITAFGTVPVLTAEGDGNAGDQSVQDIARSDKTDARPAAEGGAAMPEAVRRTVSERVGSGQVGDVQHRSFGDGLSIYRVRYQHGDQGRVLLVDTRGRVLLDERAARADDSDERQRPDAQQSRQKRQGQQERQAQNDDAPERDQQNADDWQGLERRDGQATAAPEDFERFATVARAELPRPVLRTLETQIGPLRGPFVFGSYQDRGRTVYRISYRAEGDAAQEDESAIATINIDQHGQVVGNPLRSPKQQQRQQGRDDQQGRQNGDGTVQELELPNAVWGAFVDNVGVHANILTTVALRTRSDGVVYHVTYLDGDGWMHSIDFRDNGVLLEGPEARRILFEEQPDRSGRVDIAPAQPVAPEGAGESRRQAAGTAPAE